MAADPQLLQDLRRRMTEVEARHERDGRAAGEAFWASVRAELGRTGADSSGFERSDAGGSPPGSSSGGASRRAPGGGRHSRRRGPRPRANAVPVGRGVWSLVGPQEPVASYPDEVAWADGAGVPFAESPPPGSGRPEEDPDFGLEVVPVALKVHALVGMPLSGFGEDQLRDATEHLAVLRGDHDVMLVNVVAELEARGVDSPGGLSRTDWLRSLDPGMTAGQARAFVTVGRAVGEPRWRELGARVSMRHVTVAQAAQVIDFHDRTRRVADPGEVQAAVADLIEQAPVLGVEDFARLVRHHTEQVRPPRDEDRLDEGRRASRGLWFGQPNRTGMVALRGVLDPEAAAVLRSAVDPLSVPCPGKDRHGHTIEPDPRSPATRRADALVQVVERGVAAAEKMPVTDKAKVVVTIDLDVLQGRLAGTGLAMSGEVLSAEVVRRMACDAAVIPMVLGSHGEALDVGRRRRLVEKGLRLALWQRDGGCSFPGCTIPASWCDAHHVLPWWAGGKTCLLNSALLCRRHHTYVHRHDLTATVTATSVTWHVSRSRLAPWGVRAPAPPEDAPPAAGQRPARVADPRTRAADPPSLLTVG